MSEDQNILAFDQHLARRVGPIQPAEAIPARGMAWIVYRDLYLERLDTRHPGSEHPDQVRRVLVRFTELRGLAERALSDITPIDLEQYVRIRRATKYRGKPLSNRTINNEIQILNTCFALAGPPQLRGPGRKNWGMIDHPPYVEELAELDRAPVVLGSDQIEAFLRASSSARSPRWNGMDPAKFWTAALVLATLTGLRRGALLRVKRPDETQFEIRREIFVPAEISKTKRDQIIGLGTSESIFRIVADLPTRPRQRLLPWFDRHGRPMTLGYFNNEMCWFQQQAGIHKGQRIRTKDIRSTVATELAEGFSDAIAKKRLGHAPGSVTLDKHYKGRRVGVKDHRASDMLAETILPENIR